MTGARLRSRVASEWNRSPQSPWHSFLPRKRPWSGEWAPIALQNLQSEVDIRRVVRSKEPTGSAAIIIDADGRNMIAVAAGANLIAQSNGVEDELLRNASYVLMQMENDVVQIENLIRRVSNHPAKSILNLAPAYRLDRDLLSLVDIVIVNEDEAEALSGWLGCEPTARSLSESLDTGVLRTMGGKGAEAFINGENVWVPALRVDAVDTTAAGDCFVGVLASALDRGLSLDAAMRRAAKAAAIACSRPGSQSSIPHGNETDSWS
ncbi:MULTISPECIES: PfkB family carbohydrate kinase [Rhizobium/Agrobacterium group]|uniref:PfkB family carbohydrate kinase n=1 Tax=Rhizobium/Agrobacterium group TaxID=227290 RepID=UPI0009BAF18C|nr:MULTISPECIES: PfkB family carbohydrate kinase [Rhizobium/Agrobacterium group]NIB59574.1 ribokinase [Agrobacterium tumefaciens]NSZ25029.1 ribokinase [Agrobacterium tumefaciens]NTB21119.1 ribokinase [Agrobacterium tumefaciens]QQE32361.1 ribokinase [Agrobacterium tumefaciens]